MKSQRFGWPLVAGLVLSGLAGCAQTGPDASQAAGIYCYRPNPSLPDRARWRTCTTVDVPTPQVDAEAKRFDAVPNAATVYVVRSSRGDTEHLIPIQIDRRVTAETVPRSLVRIRLPPGEHQLEFEWRGVRHTQPLQLKANEVRFVALDAAAWIWGPQYEWTLSDTSLAQERAVTARLVADLSLSRP